MKQPNQGESLTIAMAEGRPIVIEPAAWPIVFSVHGEQREIVLRSKAGSLDPIEYPQGIGEDFSWLVYEIFDGRARNGRLLSRPDDHDLEAAIKRVIGANPGLIRRALDALPPRKI